MNNQRIEWDHFPSRVFSNHSTLKIYGKRFFFSAQSEQVIRSNIQIRSNRFSFRPVKIEWIYIYGYIIPERDHIVCILWPANQPSAEWQRSDTPTEGQGERTLNFVRKIVPLHRALSANNLHAEWQPHMGSSMLSSLPSYQIWIRKRRSDFRINFASVRFWVTFNS